MVGTVIRILPLREVEVYSAWSNLHEVAQVRAKARWNPHSDGFTWALADCVSSYDRHDEGPQAKWLKNNRNVSFLSSGGQESEIQMSAGPCSLWNLEGESFLASSSFWCSLADVGAPWHLEAHARPWPPLPVSMCKFPSSYKDTRHIGLRTFPTPLWPHLS